MAKGRKFEFQMTTAKETDDQDYIKERGSKMVYGILCKLH